MLDGDDVSVTSALWVSRRAAMAFLSSSMKDTHDFLVLYMWQQQRPNAFDMKCSMPNRAGAILKKRVVYMHVHYSCCQYPGEKNRRTSFQTLSFPITTNS